MKQTMDPVVAPILTAFSGYALSWHYLDKIPVLILGVVIAVAGMIWFRKRLQSMKY